MSKRRPVVRPILKALGELYPNPTTELNHDNPWQLLVATMLSAQCTDRRVNMITPRIFGTYPDAQSLSTLPIEQIEELIRDCGLYHTKAKNLAATAAIIASEFAGEVPRDRDILMTLPGVGRKTANVVLSNAFGVDAIAVDTHVFRLAHRLGWSQAKTPEATEDDLMALLPKKHWSRAHHWLILHGRRVCLAARPRCESCVIAQWCPKVEVKSQLAKRKEGLKI
ncbi:MAG: endonuclease III [Sulfobacillus benefaciens]|uniref:Endonuclease III n=1 Tax=Sulfobacillus benefaciens TaxID=453960 RepID=A0A2T2X766_9FIRM|nr:MAG: endonuclease III [Sulfobacillus benefaciens]